MSSRKGSNKVRSNFPAKNGFMEKRRQVFVEEYIVNLVEEAKKLEITDEQIIEYIKQVKRSEK